jgi:hypothetical protein
MGDAMIPTIEQLEAPARELCKIRGKNPEYYVRNPEAAGPKDCYAFMYWRAIAYELQDHIQREHVLKQWRGE